MNALVIEAVPGVVLRISEGTVLMLAPLLEERCGWVFPSEIDRQGVLEAAAENHRGFVFFFAPAVEIAVTILSGAAQILTNLREAVGH